MGCVQCLQETGGLSVQSSVIVLQGKKENCIYGYFSVSESFHRLLIASICIHQLLKPIKTTREEKKRRKPSWLSTYLQ